MILNRFPQFENGSLLTKSMLEVLRDNSSDYINLLYSDYSDGIITGFNLSVESKSKFGKNRVLISSGVLKFSGKIYFLTEKIVLDFPLEINSYNLKLRKDISKVDGVLRNGLIPTITTESISDSEEFLLAKIKYTGGDINFTKESFFNFHEQNNRFNVIETDYSSIGNPILSSDCLYFFGVEVLKKQGVEYSAIDATFASFCINRFVSYELIKNYLLTNLSLKSLRKNIGKIDQELKLIEKNSKVIPLSLMFELLSKVLEKFKAPIISTNNLKEEENDDDDDNGIMVV